MAVVAVVMMGALGLPMFAALWAYLGGVLLAKRVGAPGLLAALRGVGVGLAALQLAYLILLLVWSGLADCAMVGSCSDANVYPFMVVAGHGVVTLLGPMFGLFLATRGTHTQYRSSVDQAGHSVTAPRLEAWRTALLLLAWILLPPIGIVAMLIAPAAALPPWTIRMSTTAARFQSGSRHLEVPLQGLAVHLQHRWDATTLLCLTESSGQVHRLAIGGHPVNQEILVSMIRRAIASATEAVHPPEVPPTLKAMMGQPQ